jgi:hypothetical protein
MKSRWELKPAALGVEDITGLCGPISATMMPDEVGN